MYEKTIVIGNAARDSEVEFSKTGKPYLRFSLGVSSFQNGKKETKWFDVVCFGKTAENTPIRKGNKIFAEGNVSINTWTNKSGETKSNLSLVAFMVRNLSPREVENGSKGTEQSESQQTETEDDDLAF